MKTYECFLADTFRVDAGVDLENKARGYPGRGSRTFREIAKPRPYLEPHLPISEHAVIIVFLHALLDLFLSV